MRAADADSQRVVLQVRYVRGDVGVQLRGDGEQGGCERLSWQSIDSTLWTEERGADRLAADHAALLLAVLTEFVCRCFLERPAGNNREPLGIIKSRQGIVEITQSRFFFASSPVKQG